LIDAGYWTGAPALLRWIRAEGLSPHGLPVALTHAHADHAGGLAALISAGAGPVWAHPRAAALLAVHDAAGLWLADTGQVLPRVAPPRHMAGQIAAGGGWAVIEAGGHATGGVALLGPGGALVTGDALWEDGLGVLRPEVDGPQVFDEAHAALDRIEATRAPLIIPGHGPPFTDLPGALRRARAHLRAWADPAHLRAWADPARLARRQARSLEAFAALARAEEADLE
jgi:glyoxylase-like metal-dependent hydrolase (beta-lactamase superfamily II)